jgi:hypothetical protein
MLLDVFAEGTEVIIVVSGARAVLLGRSTRLADMQLLWFVMNCTMRR